MRADELQHHILDLHQRSLGRVLGSDDANLVLAWRAKDEANLYRYALDGFDRYPPLTESQAKQLEKRLPVDLGFFGRGTYFSQFFGYGAQYAAQYPGAPMLLSWVVMGKVYPVTESCLLPIKDNLHGKPCVEGFDSHYALVHKATKQPISKLTDAPDADEIVIFDPAQALPRYLVYFSQAIPSVDINTPALLWVSSNEKPTQSEQQRKALDWISANKQMQVRAATSTEEAMHWIDQNMQPLVELANRGHFRIITHRYATVVGIHRFAVQHCTFERF